MDNQDLLSVRSSLEKQQLFKQCHVSNNTTCSIQVCSENYDYCFAQVQQLSDEFFDFNASCMQISLTIYEPNTVMGGSQAGTKLYNIPLGKQIVQKIDLGNMTIFMEASLKER